MPKLIKLKTAVLIPLMFIMLATLLTLVITWKSDYDFLAEEQGTRIVQLLKENTDERLKAFMIEPHQMNEVVGLRIKDAIQMENDDYERIQSVYLEFYEKMYDKFPQVSVISFGDERKNYIGVRVNEDMTKSLMLKDIRTDYMLDIYAGETMDTELLASYEGYDPTIRPWYTPAVETKELTWSQIYINADEKAETTISSINPILSDKGELIGVAEFDIKLTGITSFLKEDKTKGTGVIYIVNDKGQIISQSSESPFLMIDLEAQTADAIDAKQSEDPLIKKSAGYLSNDAVVSGSINRVRLDGDYYYMMTSEIAPEIGLDWRINIAVPESDIMGTVQNRQLVTLLVVSAFILLLVFIGMWFLSLVTAPILKGADAALKMSEGNWDIELESGRIPLYETYELVDAFNNMASHLKKSFENLEISEEKYRMLIENSEDMIYSLDKNGNFVAVNKKFKTVSALKSDQIVGKHFSDLFSTQTNIEDATSAFEKVVATNQLVTYVMKFATQSNITRILNVTLIPLCDDDNEIRLIIGTNNDITDLVNAQTELSELHLNERLRLEKAIEEKTLALEETMKELMDREKMASLGSLVSGISHEINTPLGVAITATSFMGYTNDSTMESLTSGKLTKQSFNRYIETMQESVQIIETNLSRASDLVNSFKEIAISQTNEDAVEFNLGEFIHAVILSLKHEYSRTDHEFDIRCESNVILKSYPGAYSQILTNLIMNTLKHGFTSEMKGIIKIEVQTDNDMLELIYSDNGKGISESNLKRIFDPFFTTNRQQGGSGLGLNVVYNIVTGKLNGKIKCESEIAKGTTFTIEIPSSL
ncbi:MULTISPECIES: ATP-binding protein [unclassified Fusibacter]|uniref:ATP-binding protein n=1 Tax=unclassified Fusibacter TaxID=2624464 RepID=UPI0010101D62|nr:MULTISPECIES: ATP-binding protein [unclassified Fusibacter]MCK8060622.1 ATP-binding protein [Fusibacter sp. A2]NPE22924.1 PAS domain S-box protein [Fusibacter sp. A1]RXV59991.1 PAS domain S-box protein [Fusibacter sp. A1]